MFMGTEGQLSDHMPVCRYEEMKDYIKRTEGKLSTLQGKIEQKDQEIGFLRSMLGKLSEKVDQMEKTFDQKVGKSQGIV